jgi:hypothetical protein
MTTADYDQTVDVTAYAITVAELLVEDLMFDVSERDSDIEEEFQSLRVVDRVQARFARHRGYIPSNLRSLILDAIAGRVKSVEQFVQFFEAGLKQVAFALDVPKSEMTLLRTNIATPARADRTGTIPPPRKPVVYNDSLIPQSGNRHHRR